MSSSMRPPEEPTFGRYRVIAKVRSGPITDLYQAEQSALGRHVFIKALGRGILPASPFAAALEREAKLLTELDHPNIVRLLDFVRDESTMWLVLEHVDGFTLEEVIAKKGKLSAAGAVGVALAITEALVHVHEHGIVHRDLQPHNVLVARTGVVKLANFAVAADERLPTAPELLEGSSGFGTPAYMSPEQLLGEPEDQRSDLFSVGIVLYEMLTGQRPFDAPDDRAASHRIRHDPVPPLGRTAPEVSGTLDRAVRRCLAKMPSDRHASASELMRALAAELSELGYRSATEAVAAELVRLGLVAAPSAASRRESLRPPTRREPVNVGTAARVHVLALLLVIAGGGAIQYSFAASRGASVPRGGARLELVPPRMASLRVVADPWAHVIVDGQQVETTPFAHPIPLPPGVHYVRLEHPSAPAERRTVTLGPGETVLLDVKMDVARPRSQPKDGAPRQNLTDPATP
jgi:eukaryotic-like serine/threonine-protein kinase